MIASEGAFSRLVLLVAPIVWRSDPKIAEKLRGFAATELGSALDMFKAAELTDDPELRRLFFRHGLDEARHARLFQNAADRLDPSGSRGGASRYRLIHATRQNLFAELGLVRFLAFVHLAERRGEAHFLSLIRHFADRPALAELFVGIAKDEHFHTTYSRKLLERLAAEGQKEAVERALFSVRGQRLWQTWRRLGRQIGDHLARLMFGALYFLLLPLFSALAQRLDPEKTGWHEVSSPRASRTELMARARRQF